MECILSQRFALGCYKAAPLALNLAPKARPYKSLRHTPQVQESIKRQSAEGATLLMQSILANVYDFLSRFSYKIGVITKFRLKFLHLNVRFGKGKTGYAYEFKFRAFKADLAEDTVAFSMFGAFLPSMFNVPYFSSSSSPTSAKRMTSSRVVAPFLMCSQPLCCNERMP